MKTKQMADWLRERIAAQEQKRAALWADHREDEANFEKIVHNVYDIFLAVLTAGEKVCKSEGALGQFFLQKMQSILSNWQIALEKAETYDEAEKIYVERLKLATAQEIRTKFCELWEVTA